jgi:hypothetical protein
MQKLFKKRREQKELKRNGHKSVQDIENNGYLDVHLKKKEKKKMNKIASVL